jgi:hypothetical protein
METDVNSLNGAQGGGRFSVFPTPVRQGGDLYLNTPADRPSTVLITDIIGQTLIKRVVRGSTTVNTSSLKAGMYLVRFLDGKEQIVRKVIVE